MLRRVVQYNAMRGSREKGGTRGHGLADPALCLLAPIGLHAVMLCDKADHACGRMQVAMVGHTMPPWRGRSRGDGAAHMREQVVCSPCRATRRDHKRALCAGAMGHQGSRPTADICALTAFHAPRAQRDGGMVPCQGWAPGPRVGGEHAFTRGTQGRGLQGEGGHIGPCLLGRFVRLALEPRATPMWLAIALL